MFADVYVLYPPGCVLQLVATPETLCIAGDTVGLLMIAAGYEDCDDVDTLRSDPALKIAVGRCPETGTDLMSQPTLSRLKNLTDWRALARIGLGQIALYCRSFARRPTRILLDIDDTDDPLHG